MPIFFSLPLGEGRGEGGRADEVCSYDANGNRSKPGYVTGEYNRLLSDGTYNYEYDPEGNRTKRTEIATGAVTEYLWDHRNRLVAVIERASEGGPAVQSVRYVYDSQDRWIGRVLDADGDGPAEAVASYFVYDIGWPEGRVTPDPAASPGQMLLQLDAQGQVTHRYLWGPAVDQILADEQVFPLPLGEGQGEGLAKAQGASAGTGQGEGLNITSAGTVLWPLTDHLGTVRDLARYDPASGQTTIVTHLTYDAFGRVTGQSNPAVTTLFAFTGRPLDPATGLQNHLHRWYDPAIGRWLSEEPLGFHAADANLYRYCFNTPTSMTDPSGLWGAGTGTNGNWQPPQVKRDFGHSDFYNPGGYFDFNKEDRGWTAPEIPWSTWRHFQTLEEAEARAQRALNAGDKDAFERALHDIQDYYSHRKQGWKAWNWDFAREGAKYGYGVGTMVGTPFGGAAVGSVAGWGHTLPSVKAKLGLCPTPDDAIDYYEDFLSANNKTKEWVERWRARWGEP